MAETLDWTEALLTLGAEELDPGRAAATLGAALKYREDVAAVLGNGLLDQALKANGRSGRA
ncbi:hypothetical protein [Nonomuraea sp. N2-4H]|uniref:hypothetical protein n=1 Tax=Nonomuraea sp. N2-4H TaxID=3128898 RepID=UPI003873973B